MTTEHWVYLVVFLLWLPAAVQGGLAIRQAARFRCFMRRSIAEAPGLHTPDGAFKYQPRVVIIMPCCGVDEKLHQTVRALAQQHYDDYQIIFTFESQDDDAHAAIASWTSDWDGPPARLIVAGRAETRGQKIHNLLAAVATVSPDREVLIFLDSDAVPHADWIGHLVAPLQDDEIAAATGYRWYSASGGLAAGLRCAWNAATVSLLADEKRNFVWGGSTAMRRDRFESLRIADYWDRALSDDLQCTRAIRDAGLRIRFVPQALIASTDRTTLSGFLTFAQRQVIITRICDFALWRAGLVLCSTFMAGGGAVAALFLVCILGDVGSPWAMWSALAGWGVIILLAGGMAVLRQLGLRCVLKPPRLTWRDSVWDVAGTLSVAGSLHLNLMLSSIGKRRFVWRNIEYEMVSPDETQIVRRLDERTS